VLGSSAGSPGQPGDVIGRLVARLDPVATAADPADGARRASAPEVFALDPAVAVAAAVSGPPPPGAFTDEERRPRRIPPSRHEQAPPSRADRALWLDSDEWWLGRSTRICTAAAVLVAAASVSVRSDHYRSACKCKSA
jgi:hypothetical protein